MSFQNRYRRAGPTRNAPRKILSLATLALLALAACSGPEVKPSPTAPKVPDAPNLGVTDPFNDQGNCLGEDYAAGGGGGSITETKGCTANDVRVAKADVLEYSYDGSTFFPFVGGTVECDAGTPLFLRVRAFLIETATSTRSDIGIWVANNGGTGRRKVPPPAGNSDPLFGSCNQYNLAPAPAYTPPDFTVLNGVTNVDNDQCGDMFPTAATADSAQLELGLINTICQGATPTSSLVHVGSCLSWTVPGGDRTCPTDQPGSPTGFRLGTLPSASSKCNCDGFDVPVSIRLSAKLEIAKACTPTNDAGKFNLSIDGTIEAADAACGGTTGSKTVGAGTTASPGATHTFGEAAGTGTALSSYTSSFACVNRSNSSTHASSGTVTAGSITLQPNEDVVCTITNVRKPQVKLVKDLVPDADAGRFDLTIAGTTFNNGGAGYGDGGNTGFQTVSIGTVSISEAAHTGTTLSEYGSTLSCVNASLQAVTVSSNTGTAGSITVAAGDQITCTFINNHSPKLSITKTPDAGGAGYNVSPGGTATFTVTVSNAADGGPALNVQLIDTLPAGVGDWTENPNKTECSIARFPNAGAGSTDPLRLLTCSGGALTQLNAGASFTVVVQATVPNTFLQIPPDPNGPTTPIEIDGNLVDGAAPGKDWGTAGLISCTGTVFGCDLDLPTGASDNSFGQGTSEDDAVPTVVTGSIPNNKSDLLRFYVANERITLSSTVANDFLYLAWERVQAPNGTTNMDFELNQSSLLSSNGVTPVRTAGDILVKYDLENGGTSPVLGFHRWVTSGACQKSGGKAPCWGPVISLVGNPNVAAAINAGSVDDPINPGATRSLDALTFGEASINLQATGIFPAGQCVSFGRAYLKSRSSDSFSAEIKDFIAPIPISVTNCAPRNLDNRAWARASNFTPTGGVLNGWFSDTGQIHVSDASGATGSQLTSPVKRQLAVGYDMDNAVVAADRRDAVYGAEQQISTPWPSQAASEAGVRHTFAPQPRLVT